MNDTTQANRFEMTWSYKSKLQGLKMACGDTVLMKRHKMFEYHIGDICISNVCLSKRMSSSIT